MTARTTRPGGRDQGDSISAQAERAGATPPRAESSASSGLGLSLEVEGLRYELDQPPKKTGKKVVATVRLASAENGAGLVDRVDLYSFRSRSAFATLVAESFGKTPDVVLGHLALLLDEIERCSHAAKRTAEPVLLSEPRRRAAEKLLESPDLLERAAQAIDDLGYVGEARNKRLAYLVATSRLLEKPLSAILRAPSGTGKSELLEKTAQLVPEESVEYFSRLTPQSLYYLGPDHLRHRLVLVDEQAGASDADYSIRTLQSRGLLRLATVVKGRTEPFTVNGPIALMSGTTDAHINPENLSRCLELMLDDSPEQTKLIQEAQRRAWSGESPRRVEKELWQDAQRVLETHEVAIPFASSLTFPTRTTKDRRDNMKLLSLIATHALLFQRQRDKDEKGRLIATVSDYEAVFRLFAPLVEAELEDLSPRASEVYRALVKRDSPATRREIASSLEWPYTTTRRALEELVSHELAKVTREEEGPSRYALLDSIPVGTGTELTPPKALSTEVSNWQRVARARQGSGKAPNAAKPSQSTTSKKEPSRLPRK